jgi:replication fork protection complex subunit Csm3/Swi3
MVKSRALTCASIFISFASGKQTSTTRSMDSLDSIWDEPPVETVPKRSSEPPDDRDEPHRPAKRPRQALFLSDSEDDVDASGPSRPRAAAKAPALNAELDALFADSDDEELRPLPGRIDEAEITRRAEERARREMPTLTPYQVMLSSSPPRDTGSPSGKKAGKGDAEKKERRRIVKLDEARLLNPTYGFPQLVKMTKDFKIKGKGHEVRGVVDFI